MVLWTFRDLVTSIKLVIDFSYYWLRSSLSSLHQSIAMGLSVFWLCFLLPFFPILVGVGPKKFLSGCFSGVSWESETRRVEILLPQVLSLLEDVGSSGFGCLRVSKQSGFCSQLCSSMRFSTPSRDKTKNPIPGLMPWMLGLSSLPLSLCLSLALCFSISF